MSKQEEGKKREPSKQAAAAKPKRKKKLNKTKWFFITAAFAIFCALAGYLFILLNGQKLLNDNEGKMDMAESSIIYDYEDHELTTLYRENREIAVLNEIPQLLRDAFVATEDKRFYEHSGIDFWSIGRAVVKDVIARSAVEGGSTITQQLAKNMFLNMDKTFFRKATEVSMAIALDNKYTKDEILEMYLNNIFFGHRAYGVKAAAKVYFDKPLDKLELWEMATLAGLPKAPSRFNPLTDAETSKGRRGVVLQLMYDQKLITLEQKEQAAAVDYVPPVASIKEESQINSFLNYIIDEAAAKTSISEDKLLREGYKIYTTIRPKAQDIAYKAFSNAENFPDDASASAQVQGGMVIIDNDSGGIVAMIAGRDEDKNRALERRQPGSSFKPIVAYAPALESGKYTTTSKLNNTKQCFNDYCPRNYDNRYSQGVTMAYAAKKSVNLASVWLLNEIGLKTGYSFAQSLGIPLTDNDRNLAIGLGGLSEGASPLEMAQAYSAFANQGKLIPAHAIRSIIDGNGQEIYSAKDELKTKQVMSAQTAYYVTELLKGVVQSDGTGAKAMMDRPIAGKTGSTQVGLDGITSGYRDIWFVGYTPQWTASVWMGYDRTTTTSYLHKDSGSAAHMFKIIMAEALADQPAGAFSIPKGVTDMTDKPDAVKNLKVEYDPAQGVLLSWSAGTKAGLEYLVYRKEKHEEGFTKLGSFATASLKDETVLLGGSYQYYVTTYQPKSKLESGQSNWVSILIPEPEETPDPDPIEPAPDEGNGQSPGGDGTTNGNGQTGTDDPNQNGSGGSNGGNDSGNTDNGNNNNQGNSNGTEGNGQGGNTGAGSGTGTGTGGDTGTGTGTDAGTGSGTGGAAGGSGADGATGTSGGAAGTEPASGGVGDETSAPPGQ